MQTIKAAIQNGVVAISDVEKVKPPYPTMDEKVWHTPTCITATCLHEIDGEAELILGPSSEVQPDYEPAFDGMLETPTRQIVISTVLWEPLLRTDVKSARTRVRVWRSHPVWPEQLIVGWG